MLCPAVCISDVMNKAGMCGKKYQVPVFRFSVVKSNQHGCTLRSSNSIGKKEKEREREKKRETYPSACKGYSFV